MSNASAPLWCIKHLRRVENHSHLQLRIQYYPALHESEQALIKLYNLLNNKEYNYSKACFYDFRRRTSL